MASSSSSSSLPLPSTDHQNQYTYEVFLSFRGEDTRYTFTDHLHRALIGRGIRTFRDNDELNRGEDISQELLKAIEESRVSIIVFSPNYASSRWCLDELVQILDCRRSKGQKVRSVFYKVDPSDVRKQTSAFGKGFAKLDQCKYKDRICIWKKALEEAADLSGWPYKDGEYEAKFIDDIVGELSARVVNPSCMLHVAAHPVGLESCREDVNRHLELEKNVVLTVGIWGTGGIGKTTIAKDVFNSIRHKFEGSCFLADVRSNSNGLAQLQEKLLSDVLGDSTLKVSHVDQGVGLIKTRMQRKKALIILDDVSHSSQLEKLVPSHDCFGPGSRILITTRDRGCLREVGMQVYEVKTLNDYQAMNLFSWNAFRTIGPRSDYRVLAERAIRYAQGLPLALIVLGSHLFRRSKDEWEATIGSYRGDPHTDIQGVLRLSYDALGEDLKEAFLDIACFFKGKNVEKVKPVLQACYDLKSGIEQLQEKALLRIDKGEVDWQGDQVHRIWMHDLIEEMGKKIANPEGKPDESTRLWRYDDVKRALSDNTGTKKMKGIHLKRQYLQGNEICLNAKSFSKMKNLRYFCSKFNFIRWSGDIDYLSNELRWLEWHRCPLQSFPSNFHPQNLVKLDILGGSIIRLWDGRKNLPSLKYMKLIACESLTELPDLSGIPNLIELCLYDCKSLAEIHDSVGFLFKLVTLDIRSSRHITRLWDGRKNLPNLKYINLSECPSLTQLPDLSGIPNLIKLHLYNCTSLVEIHDSVGSLEKLEIIDLNDCTGLQKFPKITGKTDSLRELKLSCSGVKELDPSIGNLSGLKKLRLCCKNLTTLPCSIYDLRNLEILYVSGCSKLVTFPRKASISHEDDSGSLALPKLRKFYIDRCNLSSADFIENLDCLETLNSLDLSFNNFVTLPALGKFNLEILNVSNCYRLREIPELPPNILRVYASDCESLERFSMWPKSLNTVKMDLGECYRFSQCLGNDMKMMENILLKNQDSRFSLVFPCLGGCEVPKWFQYCSKEVIATENGSTCAISFEIPSKLNLENIAGVAAICSGVSSWVNLRADLYINGVHIHQSDFDFDSDFGSFESDHMWLGYIPLSGEIKGKQLGGWPYKCRVEFECGGEIAEMKSCGVHLVCQQPDEPTSESSMLDWLSLSVNPERKRPHTGANDNYHHQQEQQEQPIVMSHSKRHCTEEERSMAPIHDISILSSDFSPSASTRSNLPEANLDPLPDLQLTLATPGFQ